MSQITLSEHGIASYTVKLIEKLNEGYSITPNTSRVRGSLFTVNLTKEDEKVEVSEPEEEIIEDKQVESEEFFKSKTKKQIVKYIEENYSQTLNVEDNKTDLIKTALSVVQGV